MNTVTVKEAAKILGKSEQHIRLGLIQKAFPWGAAISTGGGRYTYVIYPKLFYEMVGEKSD